MEHPGMPSEQLPKALITIVLSVGQKLLAQIRSLSIAGRRFDLPSHQLNFYCFSMGWSSH
jgi:hypothetical protein